MDSFHNMDSIKVELRSFITKFFGKPKLRDDENLSELGFVSSLFAMQLVIFVEKKFGVRIENEELDFKNFRSIDAIAKLVDSKLGNSILK